MGELNTIAFNLDKELVRLKNMVETSGFKMGKILHEIQTKQLYLQLGYDTFEMYIANPDLGFKRSTAYDLKRLYKQWILGYGYSEEELSEVGKERLLEASKVATDENKDSWLEKARTLSKGDLIATVREHQEEDVHEDYVPFPRLNRCASCGKWYSRDKDLICKYSGVH